MQQPTLLFIFSFFIMLVIDAVWLSVMSKQFYSVHIGHLMAKTPSLIPAAIFYVLYIAALTVFVLLPSLKEGRTVLSIFLYGALFGLVTYGTYDLTNQATLKDWPFIVTFIDLLWGAALTGTVACVSVVLFRHFA